MAGQRPRLGCPPSVQAVAISSGKGLDYDRTSEQLVINTLITLKTKGVAPNNSPLAETSIEKTDSKLRQLQKHADLNNPEEIKTYIANHQAQNSTKEELVKAYNYLCLANGITWTRPRYKITEKTVTIPTKDAITKIIASCKQRYKTIFTIMAEIGASPAEIHNTPRSKINMEKGEISITGRKGHESGNYKLKIATTEMLREYLTIWADEHPGRVK